jgi:peptidase M1-like protein
MTRAFPSPRFSNRHVVLLFAIAVATASVAGAQSIRPAPYPVIPDVRFQRAVEAGTRTADGTPGENYWMNTAEYTIEASLSPRTSMLRGRETAVYRNNSPDALSTVAVHLRQNIHAPGAMRNRPIDASGGVTLSRVAVDGQELLETARRNAPGYRVNGTILWIRLAEAILPGQTRSFEFGWSYRVPDVGAPRNGTDGNVFYQAYWYPQFAVYDDITGWKADQYMGNGEFYMDYATYDVTLTVPEGWLVTATGRLQNPDAVLSEQTLSRIETSRENPEYIVRVVDEEDRSAGKSTTESESGSLSWHFQAANVRDFAWGTSASFLWDMTLADVGDRDGDGASDTSEINSFWRPEAASWVRSAEFGKYAIEYLSETFFPYPYPHMTAVEGIIGGGMEYPMMTLIGSMRNDRGLFGVTVHEIAHMYFPMIVGQDEKEDTWMDEGLTSFNTSEASGPFWDDDSWDPRRQGYYRIAGTGDEIESRRHADQYPNGTSARGIAAYNKPAISLHALEGILGHDLFYQAYSEYARRWAFKHPKPYDLFNTFEDVTGQDLDWFWTTQFYTTWTLDQGVASVDASETGVTVTVDDIGLSPYPVLLQATYADGSTRDVVIPVDAWLAGARSQTATFDPGDVVRVEIDPGKFLPDVDRANNVWTK